MKPPVLIVKNITREGPGLLDRVLAEHDIACEVIDLSVGEPFPAPADYQALVVLGGPYSANDADEKMTSELKQVQAAVQQGLPYLGIGLGMHVLFRASGGNVVPSPVKEAGFADATGELCSVELTPLGRQDPLFAGLPDKLNVFQLHGATVEAGNGMQLLATGKSCPNQIVKVGERAYGIQPHFELTEPMLRDWAEQDPDLTPIGKDKLFAAFDRQRGTYTVTGLMLFRNFLNVAGLI